MKALSLFVILIGVLAIAAVPAVAANHLFDVTGIVRGHLDDGQIVIQHDEIPGYMPAMTMAFTLRDRADATCLTPGDRVLFRFRVEGDQSSAEDFTVIGRVAPPAKNAPAKTSRLRVGDVVPEFNLIDEKNQPLSPNAFRDRWTIVTFIFTRCPVPEYCPAMALRFGQLQKAIRADVTLAAQARLLSITLDPEFDRPEILRAYGTAVGADPAVWSFATGAKETIAALTKSFAVYNERNGATLDHALTTALIGPDGRVVEIWRGNGWRVADVLNMMKQARVGRE